MFVCVGKGGSEEGAGWCVRCTHASILLRLHGQHKGIQRVKNKLLKVTAVAVVTINFAKKNYKN